MPKILINGNFLSRPLTGIERFAYETVSCMDGMLGEKDDIALLASRDCTLPQYKEVALVPSKKPLRSFPLWDMGTFAHECARQGRVALSFSNTAPLGKRCGFAFIHDVYCKDCPEDFVTAHEKAVALYTDFMCRNICRNALAVLTVSDFSAQRIAEHYRISRDRIAVITNGWDHFSRIVPDDGVFSRFPQLERGAYYFTLGSLQKRKNLDWVLQCAKRHPKDTFAIAGAAVSGYVSGALGMLSRTPNIVMTGRLSDGEVKSLMAGCKAFLFPSLYEGFGIPPLEVLSCGAQVIASGIPVFREIYGSSVHYIDPHNADADIDALLLEETAGREEVLEKHTYRNAASALLSVIKQAQ